MKSYVLLTAILALLTNCFALSIPSDSLYRGQMLPGVTATMFNLHTTPGLVPSERMTISTDGTEIYYGELNGWPATNFRIKSYIYRDNHWEGPNIVFENFAAPMLSPDNNTLYLERNTSYSSSESFFSERTETGWTTPKRVVDRTKSLHYMQKTNLNNVYVSSSATSNTAMEDLFKLLITTTDTTLIGLGKPVNTSSKEVDFFIDRDESYLIVCRAVGNSGEMFISYKKQDGKWTNPKNLGNRVNQTGQWAFGPSVTYDRKFLFFSKGGSTLESYSNYWVKIDDLIDSLKNTNYVPYANNAVPNITDTLGRAFSYTFTDSTFIDDDGNNTLTYSAKLSNGSSLPAWLSFDPATRTFSGTLQQAGSYTIKITATDNLQAAATTTFILKVVNGVGIGDEDKFKQLNHAYPNPFNPSTTISFNLQKESPVDLTIFNANGETVTNLINSRMKAGSHSAIFNAANLNSGIYFYRLTAGEQTVIKKIALIK